MNIKQIIRKNIVAMVAVATIIGFSSFKVAKKFLQPEDGWYEVQQINPSDPNPNNPSNLEITSHLSSGLPSGGDCQAVNSSADRCAVYLNLEDFTTPSPIGMSVSTATNGTNQGAVDPSSAGTTDGFAKRTD